MKINTIRPYYYFLDNVKVNWKLPFDLLSTYHREIIKEFYHEFHKLLTYNVKTCFTSNGVFGQIATNTSSSNNHINIPEFPYVHIHKKDPHYNYKVEWGGKFFTHNNTKHIKKDVHVWFKDYLHIHNFIIDSFYDNLETITGKDLRSSPTLSIKTTVSRVDIAKNHKGNMFNVIPLSAKNRHSKHIRFYQEDSYKNKPYIYGLSIGKRDAKSGVHFRCYDKRFDLEGIQSSLERFGSIYFVRKEWELKSRILRRWGISSPEDLMESILKKDKLTEIVFRMRKSADSILMKDNQLYRSIHNEMTKRFINPLEGYTMNEHSFDKMMKRKANIFSTKVNSDKVRIHSYNPMKQLNGLIEKRGIHLSPEEIQDLINKLLKNYQMDSIDFDEYEKFIEETMEFIKKDQRIIEGLKEIKKKKEEINNYTKSLISNYKKKTAAQV